MRIIRNGEIIYNSLTTEDFPPELIENDVVEMDDGESFSGDSGCTYDAINTGEAKKSGTVLSIACPGISFEPIGNKNKDDVDIDETSSDVIVCQVIGGWLVFIS